MSGVAIRNSNDNDMLIKAIEIVRTISERPI
jgi:hypothetical protein